MKFDKNFIKELADIINEKGLSEVSLKDGEQSVTLKREMAVSGMVQASVQPVTLAESDNTETIPSGHAITSPMVGTYYPSPSPDVAPFVEIGKEIKEGEIVCVIEAMKLMNEIKSEYSGKITQICVNKGDQIEYGQVLMYVE